MDLTFPSRESHRFDWLLRADTFLVTALFVVAPTDHTPALRAALCLLLGLRGISLLSVRFDLSALRYLWALLLWVAWASASYCWSFAPLRTWGSLYTDLWLPLFAFFGIYKICQLRKSLSIFFIAILAGSISNTALTIFGASAPGEPLYPLDWAIHYFSTTGYSSTFAIFYSAMAMPWLFHDQKQTRAFAVVVLGLNLLAALVDQNRIFFVIEAFFFCVILLKKFKSVSKLSKIFFSVSICALFAVAVHVNVQRTNDLRPDEGRIANFVRHIKTDSRAIIWRFWVDKAYAAPVRGVGFGRDVPSMTVSDLDRQSEVFTTTLGSMHSHNFLIQTALETGLVGLVLLLTAIGQCMRNFLLLRTKNEQAAMAGLLLILALILKNMTDVFTLYGPAILFYAALGMLLALAGLPSLAENEASANVSNGK